MLGIFKKLAGDKLLQLPIESLFTKGLVKSLDILNVDYRESHSESDMKWKILLRHTEGRNDFHFSIVLCFKILESNKNQDTSVKNFELKFALILAHLSVLFPLLFLLCLHFVKRLFKLVHQILTKQPSH